VLFWGGNTRDRNLHAGFANFEVHDGQLRASHPKARSPASITGACDDAQICKLIVPIGEWGSPRAATETVAISYNRSALMDFLGGEAIVQMLPLPPS
jgi:hypothetical protein